MNERWHCFSGTGELDTALARHLAQRLQADIQRRGQASLALSGGSTPKGLFHQLAGCPVDWSSVWLTLVDERWVELAHADSNEGMLRQLLYRGPVQAAHLIGLKTPHTQAAEGQFEAEQRFRALPRPLTAVVLGMGEDGHTASWFPCDRHLAALLAPDGDALVAATDAPTATHQRMTLTLPAILDSAEIIIHITGERKRGILQNALRDNLPIAAVLRQELNPASIWWAPND